MCILVKRTSIAVIYSYSENWIGGTYYIENLISALNLLQVKARPHVIVVSSESDYSSLIKRVNYPYLERFRPSSDNLAKKILRKVGLGIFLSKVFKDRKVNADILFPANFSEEFSMVRRRLFWVPDFQEFYLPGLFSQEEVESRKKDKEFLAEKPANIVFSSVDAKDQFRALFPASPAKLYVLRFATSMPLLDNLKVADVFKKYGISDRYFICCNQFWKHKNHRVYFEAIKKFSEKQPGYLFCFTGSPNDYRHPGYFQELMELTKSLGIEDRVRFTGFIDRPDQLVLIRESLALVQPSLFEGWSTVVEDGKALNVRMVVSDLAVHHEQLDSYPDRLFFDPHSPDSLAEALLASVIPRTAQFEGYQYSDNIASYAETFVEIVERVIG